LPCDPDGGPGYLAGRPVAKRTLSASIAATFVDRNTIASAYAARSLAPWRHNSTRMPLRSSSDLRCERTSPSKPRRMFSPRHTNVTETPEGGKRRSQTQPQCIRRPCTTIERGSEASVKTSFDEMACSMPGMGSPGCGQLSRCDENMRRMYALAQTLQGRMV